MRIARDGDASAVEIARGIELAQLFECLSAVEIGGGVVGIGLRDSFERRNGMVEIAGLDVLHGESIAGERATRVLLQQLLEDFDSCRFQTARIHLVACPFFKPVFRPVTPMEWGSVRAPLGGVFEGECEMERGAGEPRLCNFGYARGLCASFPENAVADAVRFSVSGSSDGVVKVVWILEKDHAPVEHGALEYRESTGEFVEAPEGVLGAQARVFVENYSGRPKIGGRKL